MRLALNTVLVDTYIEFIIKKTTFSQRQFVLRIENSALGIKLIFFNFFPFFQEMVQLEQKPWPKFLNPTCFVSIWTLSDKVTDHFHKCRTPLHSFVLDLLLVVQRLEMKPPLWKKAMRNLLCCFTACLRCGWSARASNLVCLSSLLLPFPRYGSFSRTYTRQRI